MMIIALVLILSIHLGTHGVKSVSSSHSINYTQDDPNKNPWSENEEGN